MLNLKDFSPCLLLAMPQLRDPNFSHAVVLLAEYKPTGAFGLVVNRPLQLRLGDVQSPDVRIAERFHGAQLWYGGPVNPQQAVVVATMAPGEAEPGTEVLIRRLADGIGLANPQAMVAGREPDVIGPQFKVIIGCAGWGGGQLDQELGLSSWLVVPATPELIFSEPATMWERAVRDLGVDPATLQIPTTVLKH